ncbi:MULTISPECIES: DUF2790 domain-containing protein [Pseudomonas]|uniref:DUF2790 domain-containing protein n=1 Tax=Pseudomonas kuykendallii TaxID=1007099 RepID=A0A2W5CZT7_9PSED|nr:MULTISPECIES: DUF2790 domain-containing protein [Pseudomonas]MCQ4272018.1 DUF2790 domain-containing protein [Pseudomonas kuykendallii]PZP23034.1 MAG: DUF2790 domain-containing protein [Pseudomonas kuykendallii]SDX20531.1 Protein of unknown function [Pseudomonas kuykendallii]
MKIASVISTVISSFAPFAFATDAQPGSDIPPVDYQYGMQLDVKQVLHRTDNTGKTGVVPTIMVYQDSKGEVHKIRFLEWGGKTSEQS